MNTRRLLWTLSLCAIVLCLAAWSRGAEYDEQYTLFLTSGVPRPNWPVTVFPAGMAREIQSGHADMGSIARDLRLTDVHPPLYFWLVALWRDAFGPDLFVARLLSVLLGVAALALTGLLARSVGLPAAWAMLLTMGCYGFTYTSVVARGFALAQVLLVGGVLTLSRARRVWHFALAGALFGAATFSNYLAVFVAGACLLVVGAEAVWPRLARAAVPPGPSIRPGHSLDRSPRQALAAVLGFVIFIPADLWWYLAQRDSRQGQFPPFSLTASLARLAVRFSGAVLGGLPLYVSGVAAMAMSVLLALLLLWLVSRIIWRWRLIATPRARTMFAAAALAPVAGLLALGLIFNNSPIEVRYLAFSTPFVGLLLAGALGGPGRAVLLIVQAGSIVGLMFAPRTMQPARAAAQAAAALVGDGVVLLPRGNDGVGVVGAFAIESPPALPLLLISADATPEQIRTHLEGWHRVVLALVEQDDASRAAAEAMRRAMAAPEWREVAHGTDVAVYERRDGE